MRRRAFVVALAALAVSTASACARKPRCARCGMVLDPTSRWQAELRQGTRTERFDTPKCAFAAFRGDGRAGWPEGTTLRLRGYYTQRELDAAEAVFGVGSDVVGPMGTELVPVEAEHAAKFVRDHGGRTVKAGEITAALADDPR